MRLAKDLDVGDSLLPSPPSYPKVECSGFGDQKVASCVCVCFSFLPLHHQSLRVSSHATLHIGNTHEYSVRRQICC